MREIGGSPRRARAFLMKAKDDELRPRRSISSARSSEKRAAALWLLLGNPRQPQPLRSGGSVLDYSPTWRELQQQRALISEKLSSETRLARWTAVGAEGHRQALHVVDLA